MKRQDPHRHDIRTLLIVLGSAISCAVLLAFLLIYHYGPSGRYMAGYALLDPAILGQTHQQRDPKKGRQHSFHLDRLEFSYADPQRGLIHHSVSLENYQRFYTLIATDRSLKQVTEKIEELFIESHPTTLTLMMHLTGSTLSSSSAQESQTMQLIPEDYYRMRLPNGQHQGKWVYFYHSQIYQEAMHLFNQATRV